MRPIPPLSPALRRIHLGCSGWSLSGPHQERFPLEGSHLQRYAQRMNAVEITSSFYRHHRHATYVRWGEAVPPDFRFAVKVPREITHERRLVGALAALEVFLEEVSGLGSHLGPLLIQLPPSLAWDRRQVTRFLDGLRRRYAGEVVCEPRHPSWFAPLPDRVLTEHHIARVAADPARVPAAGAPGGWSGLGYLRLHGSPVMYRSSYSDTVLSGIASTLRAMDHAAWCIFDNTMLNAALANALTLQSQVCAPPSAVPG